MLDRVGQADRVYGVSAAVTVIATFLPWYRFDTTGSRVTANAFGAGFCGDIAFFAAAAAVLALLVRYDVITMRSARIDAGVMLALAATALGAVVLQMLIGINGSGAFHSITVGIVVALLSSAGMVVGAWAQREDERGTGRVHSHR